MQCVMSYDLNELFFEKFILDKNIFDRAFYLVSTRLFLFIHFFNDLLGPIYINPLAF